MREREGAHVIMGGIRTLCIIGVGLIAGSLARDLRKRDPAMTIVGCGRARPNLQRAVELGVIDRFELDPRAAVNGADMVVLGVPLGAMRSVFQALSGALADDAVVTDVGSAKHSVIADASAVFGEPPPWFVPGHPVAGTENSGVDASIYDLFKERRVILTPLATTAPAALERVRGMWEGVGASVIELDAEYHDQVLAATSHLPHMLAFALVDALAQKDERAEIFDYAAGGFKDFTRVASSDPQMWHDICIANRVALLESLEHFQSHLSSLTDAVREQDGEFVRKLFARAKATRDEFVRKGER